VTGAEAPGAQPAGAAPDAGSEGGQAEVEVDPRDAARDVAVEVHREGQKLHPDGEVDDDVEVEVEVEVEAAPGTGGLPREPGEPEGGFAVPLDPDVPDQDPAVRLRRDLEAILLVADQPVTVAALAGILGRPTAHVEDVLVELAAEYASDQRGFVLRAVAGGWRLYTHPASHPAVDAYLHAGTQQRLTQAALETLAVIAYRQPVTRSHVAAVRGVNVDGVLRTLLNRGLVAEVGRDDGPGQAVLYGTTPLFLEQLGINGVYELPPVADYLPDGVDLSGLEENW
jgi:segregation and condensation protein B